MNLLMKLQIEKFEVVKVRLSSRSGSSSSFWDASTMGNTHRVYNTNTKKEGYLLKSLSSSRQLRRYYAVLTEQTLLLFLTESCEHIVEGIDLKLFSNIQIEQTSRSKRFALIPSVRSQQMVTFIASAAESIHEWVSKLQSSLSPNPRTRPKEVQLALHTLILSSSHSL